MNRLNNLDIRSSISLSIKKVFATMLSMDVVITGSEKKCIEKGNRMVVSVGFAGDVSGTVKIHLSNRFAHLITAALFDMEVDEVAKKEQIHDVIGELCNMIGGDLKSRFCDCGLPCKITIPSVASGSKFSVESKDWIRKDLLSFGYQEHTALVEVYIKPGLQKAVWRTSNDLKNLYR